jgi:hypothetical protein
MWLARKTKLAWALSSLYAPAGGPDIGAIAPGPADSAACDNPLCRPIVAAKSAATTARKARFGRFAQTPPFTGGVLKWLVIGGVPLVSD